jgi:uncharacterized membrane protein YgdD (TMEM256/DUF423 family)
MSPRVWWVAGCLVGFVAVALGAFGAHGLPGLFAKWDLSVADQAKRLEWFEVGTRYAAYHAFALLALAWAARRAPSRAATVAGVGFVLGVLLFTGSLVVMTFTGIKVLGAVTPFGGLGFLVGWAALSFAGRDALEAGVS